MYANGSCLFPPTDSMNPSSSTSDSDIVCYQNCGIHKTVTNFETEFDEIADVPKEYNMAIILGALERRNKNDNDNNCKNALQISTPVITL